ncbi:MAG: hypothetical protein E4H36_12845 [Spirochaetales bacterium]|nr:MAG: hypothetical protein E4H36_12845 [Spirochaetales bacterium]
MGTFSAYTVNQTSRLVSIIYIDNYGTVSERTIRPLRTYKGRNGYTYIEAYCYLRGETRTFRKDHILTWTGQPSQGVSAPARDVPAQPGAITPPLRVPVEKVYKPAEISRMQPAARKEPKAVIPPHGKKAPSGFGIFFRIITAMGFIGGILYGVWNSPGFELPDLLPDKPGEVYDPEPAARVVVKPAEEPAAPVTAAAPAVEEAAPPPPVTVTTYSEYRGFRIKVDTTGSESACTVEDLQISTTSYYVALRGINDLLFREATGMANGELENIYASADKDGSGALSWEEVIKFQSWLAGAYAYRFNEAALWPYQFMIQRGGDCEDWALFTCGLLRYWGWESYVGAFMPPGGYLGHAITLVYSQQEIIGFGSYSIEEHCYLNGRPVKAGCYIPIDYEKVGDISDAMEADWELKELFVPEEIYGRQM